MRFASLGSGSRGNAMLVEAGETRVLLDCGFSCAEMERRLARLSVRPEEINAILVTHEHADHISGVARFSRRFRIPVWMTAGTEAVHQGGDVYAWNCFSSHQPFEIDGISIEPFPVPHDAREPCQFVFIHGNSRLGVLTDAGSVTAHMLEALGRLDALVLECNHDADMLAAGPYPPPLKQRVGGPFGHLSNDQAARLVRELDHTALQYLVAAHISDKNNRPELALSALAGSVGWPVRAVLAADQEQGLPWCDLL